MKSIKFLFSFAVFAFKSKLILTIQCQNVSSIEVNFWPQISAQIGDNQNKTINITVTSDCPPVGQYVLSISSNNEQIIGVSEHTFPLTSHDIRLAKNLSFTLEAKSIGRSSIQWSLNYVNDDRVIATGVYLSSVVHEDFKIRVAFTIAMTVLVIINNINMGCQLDWNLIKSVLRKPISPSIGFLSQFLVMPVGSYLYGKLFFPDNPSWRFGLLTLGCSPGGTISNFWTLLFYGDVNLSITMTFFSTIAALAMMPFWMFVLGHQIRIDNNAEINIPYTNLVLSLIGMTIPLALGLLIQHRKPDWAKKSRKIIRPFTAVFLMIAIGGGIYVNFHLLKLFTWNVILAGMCASWTGYIFGALAAFLAKLTLPQITAVSIETALQNIGIAFILLQLSLPQPESDLAAVPLIGQIMMTGPPLWIAYLIFITVRRLTNKHRVVKDMSFADEDSEVAKEVDQKAST